MESVLGPVKLTCPEFEAEEARAFPDFCCFQVAVHSLLLRLGCRRLFLPDLRQLAIREETTNRPNGHPPPENLLAR